METEDMDRDRSSPAPAEPSDDAARHASADPADAAIEPLEPVRWPPPGLVRLHGDAYVAVRWLAAGAFLVLPLLLAVTAPQDPWSMGPLGETMWLVYLLAAVGLPVVVGGYAVLIRLFVQSANAVGRGHHWKTVALVTTDHRRDTGFMLQGSEAYRYLTPARRHRLATNRVLVGGLLLFGAFWLTLGFGAAVVLAARGVLGPWGIVVLTLAPSVAAGAVAVILYLWEEAILRKVRKRWQAGDRAQALSREEIRAWQADMAERAPGVPAPDRIPDDGGRARTVLRVLYVAASAATVVAFVPLVTLVFSAAVIPILTRISIPEFEGATTRYAAVEPLRANTLEPDPSITATEAGELLHTLSFVGRPYRAAEGVLPPEREFPAPWFPPESDDVAPRPSWWADQLVARMGQPLNIQEEEYLDRVANHLAHRRLARLARAPAMDVAAARWSMPLPSDVTMAELSMPTMASVREAGIAHLAVAALQAARGDVARADTTIREVLSIGLLLADEGPTVVDNLMGVGLAEMAGNALESLYRNTGRGDAAALAWGLESSARSADRAGALTPRDPRSTLRIMPEAALDSVVARGVRWEYVGLLNTVGPCMNLKRMVFGPDQEYRSWLESAEAGLVRTPAEAELFETARGGLLGRDLSADPPASTRVLALTMGGADQPGSCARVLGDMVGF